MDSQFATDLSLLATRRRALRIGGLALSGAALAACGSGRASGQEAACIGSPSETRGPFPADGVGGRGRLNVLAMDGIERSDIRASFAGMTGRAEGVVLTLELAVAAGRGCGPLAGIAVYLWQNDAAGAYSMYDLSDANYLRGLQQADGEGRMRFTTIVPGCYGGRYPHCHFEVFESTAVALGGAAPLLVSQLAFPESDCREIYRDDARYGDSLRNLARQPIARDFVFSDADDAVRARQTVIMSGDPVRGYRGAATVVLA